MNQKDYLLEGKYPDQRLLGLRSFAIRLPLSKSDWTRETRPGNSFTPKTNLSTQSGARIRRTLLEKDNSLPAKVGIIALLLFIVLNGADQQLQGKYVRESTIIRHDGRYILEI